MKADHIGKKPDERAYDREIVLKQLVVLGIIVVWLIVSAFLFSACSDSPGPDDVYDSTLAGTSGGAAADRSMPASSGFHGDEMTASGQGRGALPGHRASKTAPFSRRARSSTGAHASIPGLLFTPV